MITSQSRNGILFSSFRSPNAPIYISITRYGCSPNSFSLAQRRTILIPDIKRQLGSTFASFWKLEIVIAVRKIDLQFDRGTVSLALCASPHISPRCRFFSLVHPSWRLCSLISRLTPRTNELRISNIHIRPYNTAERYHLPSKVEARHTRQEYARRYECIIRSRIDRDFN